MAAGGTTTVISSGKDVYIHYAARRVIAFALANDRAEQGSGAYCEPGGYYELGRPFHETGGGHAWSAAGRAS
jgi:hypothetical protein